MPEIGCFHRPFMSLRADWWASSPFATACLRCLSCALITSSAVLPWSGRSHGPPSSLHVMVFMSWPPFAALMPNLGAAWPSALIRSCSTYIDLVAEALLVAVAVAAVPVAVLPDRRGHRWLVLLEARRALSR